MNLQEAQERKEELQHYLDIASRFEPWEQDMLYGEDGLDDLEARLNEAKKLEEKLLTEKAIKTTWTLWATRATRPPEYQINLAVLCILFLAAGILCTATCGFSFLVETLGGAEQLPHAHARQLQVLMVAGPLTLGGIMGVFLGIVWARGGLNPPRKIPVARIPCSMSRAPVANFFCSSPLKTRKHTKRDLW